MTLKEELGYGLDALVLFRGLQQNPVIHALMEFCHADSNVQFHCGCSVSGNR